MVTANPSTNGIEAYRPRLALTLGDPAGIGPEVVLKALVHPEVSEQADIVVVGDCHVLDDTYQRLKSISEHPLADPASVVVDDCQTRVQAPLGTGTAASGAASFAYLNTAIARTQSGAFDGIVTAPIAKFAWAAAGHRYPGQTEVLARAANVDRFGMMFAARSPVTGWPLLVLLATTHIPLCQVPNAVTSQLVRSKLDLLVETLQADFGIEHPTIAVAGLNPHSGEAGQLGSEEVEWLTPLLAAYPGAKGPIPPDTMWVEPGQAWNHTGAASVDAYLALYHDQGLIPVKLLAFDRAVNVTVGLPFIRTSPDHGTAFDLAGQGRANPQSEIEAILLAIAIAKTRHRYQLAFSSVTPSVT